MNIWKFTQLKTIKYLHKDNWKKIKHVPDLTTYAQIEPTTPAQCTTDSKIVINKF